MLILGDFIMIYKAQDKNISCLNLYRLMEGLSIRLINYGSNRRKYTWSNKEANPTKTRIDRFCLDCSHQAIDGGTGTVEDAAVAMLPDEPGDQAAWRRPTLCAAPWVWRALPAATMSVGKWSGQVGGSVCAAKTGPRARFLARMGRR